jgi:TonB family protein
MNGNKKAQGHYRYMEPEYRQGKFNYYSEDGKLSATRTFFSKEHGTSTYYYPNGNVMVTRKYNEGIEIDSLKSYYASGELKRIQLFSGKTPTGKVYTKTGADTVFYAYEERAFYKGTKQELDEFAYRHLIYPKQAKKDGFKGIVIVLCTVTENGILEEAKVLKTSHDFLNDNALEFVKKIPAWNPSRNDGVPYKSKAIISINFGFR